MLHLKREYRERLKSLHVFISSGNRKTGQIPAVSLIPVADCVNCANCAGSCYDLRHDCIYKGTMATRAKNSALATWAPERYFFEISTYCKLYEPRRFRWHIGGDIPTASYFAGMVKVAEENPQTVFLAFTKSNRIVNAAIKNGLSVPENLKIVFSNWFGAILENPYNFATSNPMDINGNTTTTNTNALICPGDCASCKRCFQAQKGDAVIFPLH